MDRGTASEHTAQLRGHADALMTVDPDATDADLVDQLRALEESKAKACAAQVAITIRLAASQEAAQREAGVPEKRIGIGVGSQVGLAKRESPAKGRNFVSFSRVLLSDLPCTYAALADGRTTEHRAHLVVTRTQHCTPEQRRRIDAEIGPHLEGWGDRDVELEVVKRIQRLDPAGAAERAAKAAETRRVTLRTEPDAMSFLTGHVPAAYGVAAHAALTRDADRARAAGDPRSHGQIMADLFFERLTGLSSADSLPITVNLVMTDQTMLNVGVHADEPAHVEGYGPIPADLARQLLLAADASAAVWVQRLFRHPRTGELAAIDSRARFFRGALRKLIVARDQRCRTPWCGAPIRHVDHASDSADGGPTSGRNGEGLCEACNYAKTAPGWWAIATETGRHVVITSTPTGHRYRSRAPDPPRTADPSPPPEVQVDIMWPGSKPARAG